jgi:hypothetical protein
MANKKTPAKPKTALVKASDYKDFDGQGYEHQTQEDIAMPFINILQSGSPQVVEKTVKGAKPGQIFNTVTQELFDEMLFLAATTRHVFVEWIPRDKGGGFVAEHAIDSDIVKAAKEAASEFGVYTLENGNELVETFYFYGVHVNEKEVLGLGVIPFDSSKIKAYKKINTRLQSFMLKMPDGRKVRPPMFSHLLRLETVVEKNPKGTWFNFNISPAKGEVMPSMIKPNDPRFEAASQCRDLIEKGIARADYSSAGRGSTDEEPPF